MKPLEKVEDKVTCKYCGKEFSKAGIANHEKACSENPDNKVKDEEVVTEEVKVTEVVEDEEVLVDIVMKDSLDCYIGDRYYRLKKGVSTKVPVEVKERLRNAGLLEAI